MLRTDTHCTALPICIIYTLYVQDIYPVSSKSICIKSFKDRCNYVMYTLSFHPLPELNSKKQLTANGEKNVS